MTVSDAGWGTSPAGCGEAGVTSPRTANGTRGVRFQVTSTRRTRALSPGQMSGMPVDRPPRAWWSTAARGVLVRSDRAIAAIRSNAVTPLTPTGLAHDHQKRLLAAMDTSQVHWPGQQRSADQFHPAWQRPARSRAAGRRSPAARRAGRPARRRARRSSLQLIGAAPRPRSLSWHHGRRRKSTDRRRRREGLHCRLHRRVSEPRRTARRQHMSGFGVDAGGERAR